MEQTKILSIGQVVSTSLCNAGKGVIVNIHGEQKNQTVNNLAGVISSGGHAEFDIIYFSGEKLHRLPERILHCPQWQITNEIFEQNDIDALIQKAEEFERAEKMAAEKEREEFNANIEIQRKNEKYAHLTQYNKMQDNEVKIVGKNIRADLKKHFPKTKFSVRMRHYTAYYVSWTDGPTSEQIESLLNKYKTGCFDAYQDYHYSEDTPFTAVYGGIDYIFTHRTMSDEAIQQAIDYLLDKYTYGFDSAIVTLENYHNGKLSSIGKEFTSSPYGIAGEIGKVLSKMTF